MTILTLKVMPSIDPQMRDSIPFYAATLEKENVLFFPCAL